MGSNVIANILKRTRKELNLSVKAVLEQLHEFGIDISDKTLYGWESGHRQPDADTFLVLCRIYGVDSITSIQKMPPLDNKAPFYSSEALELAQDYDELDGHGKRVIRLVADEEKARCIERAHSEQAGESSEIIYFNLPEYDQPMSAGAGQPAGDGWAENLFLTKQPPRGASYVARISGDSMEPTYHDGDRLFIQATVDIQIGQVGVFFMDSQQWVKELGDGVLISHNPAYPPRSLTEDVRCQGLVLGVCDDSYFA